MYVDQETLFWWNWSYPYLFCMSLIKVLLWPKKTILCKRRHKLNRIGVKRKRMFPFLPIPFTTPSQMIWWKLGCLSRGHKQKNQPIARPWINHCHWFILLLLLATLTMQFSLDHKRQSHKQNQCSACDSIVLIFTTVDRIALPFWLQLWPKLCR